MSEIILAGKAFTVSPLTIRQLRALLPLKDPSPEALAISLAHLNASANPQDEGAGNGASAAEITVAFKIVMALSGLGKAEAPDGTGAGVISSVRIGPRDYPLPTLSVEQLESIRTLPQATENMSLGESLDMAIRDVHAILSPTYPELTRELLEEQLDLPRIFEINVNVRAQMDFAKLSFTAPGGRA